MTQSEIKVFPSIEELSLFAAEEFVRLASDAIAARGRFAVALSGGSTPKKLYELLASEEFKNKIKWRNVHFFWGDERNVLPDDAESNFRAANDSLLSKIDLPRENVHRFSTEDRSARIVAEKMETEIREFFQLNENEFPRFDLILLGVGADGHTASLFPETAALEERERIVVENFVPRFDQFRLTLTTPAINNACCVIFLAAGADKAQVLREILESEFKSQTFPAQMIHPKSGKLLFLLEESAASLLRD